MKGKASGTTVGRQRELHLPWDCLRSYMSNISAPVQKEAGTQHNSSLPMLEEAIVAAWGRAETKIVELHRLPTQLSSNLEPNLIGV